MVYRTSRLESEIVRPLSMRFETFPQTRGETVLLVVFSYRIFLYTICMLYYVLCIYFFISEGMSIFVWIFKLPFLRISALLANEDKGSVLR